MLVVKLPRILTAMKDMETRLLAYHDEPYCVLKCERGWEVCKTAFSGTHSVTVDEVFYEDVTVAIARAKYLKSKES